jgi:drug/metabolite transporter (DMT)-like permease
MSADPKAATRITDAHAGHDVELKAAAAAAVGSICVGFVPYFVTGLQHAGVSTITVLFFRYLVALAVLIPLALWNSHGIAREWREGGKGLFVNALTLGALQTYCYFKALESLASSIVVTIFYCYPAITLIIDRFVFRLPLHVTTLFAVVMVMAGVALTSAPGFTGATLDPVGLFFAALTPVGYAIYTAVAYPMTRKVSPLAAASFIYLSLAFAFGIAVLIQGATLPPRPELWLNLVFIGTLGGAVQIASFAYALPRLSSSGYALIVCLELVTVVLVGVVLLGETLLPLQWLGALLVLFGILLDRLIKAWRKP